MDTLPFSSEEKELLQRYGFPSHGIYSRGVAEKDVVTSMGMPFYRYRVFRNPTSYIMTRRQHSAERERPVGDEKRVDAADSLEELLSSNERLLESKKTKSDMKLSESKLRPIVRKELQRVDEIAASKQDVVRQLRQLQSLLDKHGGPEGVADKVASETPRDIKNIDTVVRKVNSELGKLGII